MRLLNTFWSLFCSLSLPSLSDGAFMWPPVNSEAIENMQVAGEASSGPDCYVKHHRVTWKSHRNDWLPLSVLMRWNVRAYPSTTTWPASSAFAVGAVGEPAAEGGEYIVPNSFFTILGGADM